MCREPFSSIASRHRHIHTETGSVESHVQTFAVQERNRCARIRHGGAHLDYFVRNGTGSLIGTEQKILLDRLSQYTRILEGGNIVIGNALLRCKFKCSRRLPRDAPKGKRLYQFQQSLFGVVTRKTVKHFRSIQKTDADTILGSGSRRLNLAGL